MRESQYSDTGGRLAVGSFLTVLKERNQLTAESMVAAAGIFRLVGFYQMNKSDVCP